MEGGVKNPLFKHVSGIDLLAESGLDLLKYTVENHFTEPFHIINSVGYFYAYEFFENTPLPEQDKVMNANYTAVRNTAFALLPHQLKTCKKQRGHFIAFSCHSTIYNYPTMAPFVAAKSALETFMKQMHVEYGNQINYNMLQLVTIDTPAERNLKPNGDFRHWLKPTEIAEQVWQLSKQPTLNNKHIRMFKPSLTFAADFFKRTSPIKDEVFIKKYVGSNQQNDVGAQYSIITSKLTPNRTGFALKALFNAVVPKNALYATAACIALLISVSKYNNFLDKKSDTENEQQLYAMVQNVLAKNDVYQDLKNEHEQRQLKNLPFSRSMAEAFGKEKRLKVLETEMAFWEKLAYNRITSGQGRQQ